MVALSSPAVARATALRRDLGWGLASLGVLLVGLGLRLVLGSGEVGDRSAVVMSALLALGAWLTAMLLSSSPRIAFVVTVGVVVLLDLAALPPRFEPGYDGRDAFYRSDQVLTAHVPAAPGVNQAHPTLTLVVEPVFPASAVQPRFGLAGDVNGAALSWDCPFRRGQQPLALPLPPSAVGSGPVDIRLHLTGSPSRESDYLLVYNSAPRGGYLVSLVPAADVGPTATNCSLQ